MAQELARFREEEIQSFLEKEKLKKDQPLELRTDKGKLVHIGIEDFLEKVMKYLKEISQLK